MAIQKILDEVAAERERQKQQGYSEQQDDFMGPLDWQQVIADYSGWAGRMLAMRKMKQARQRYAQVAALAVAAIEAIDRHTDYGDIDVADLS